MKKGMKMQTTTHDLRKFQDNTGWPVNTYSTESMQAMFSPQNFVDPHVFDMPTVIEAGTVEPNHWFAFAGHFHCTPQLTADPLPAMNRHFAKGLACAVTVAALSPVAGVALSDIWPQNLRSPSTAVKWDNVVERLISHPTMNSTQVKKLLEAMPEADVVAIRDLYDLTDHFFGDLIGLEREYEFHRDFDTNEPLLFLTIRTHGLDVDELLRREIALHEEAAKYPSLKAAANYHVISAV